MRAARPGGRPHLPDSYAVDPTASSAHYAAIVSDPETCPPGAAAPAEVCPGWEPWLEEDWRVPDDPQVREGLLGPVVGTWTTPGGGQCREHEYGAKVCDFPGGSTFVWVVEDRAMWMQHSGGDMEWVSRSGNDQPPPPSNGDPDPEDRYEADKMDEAEATLIARHALLDENEQPRGRMMPGAGRKSTTDVEALAQYLMRIVNGMELQKHCGLVPAVGEGSHWRGNDDAKGYWDKFNGNVIACQPEGQRTDSTVFHRPEEDKGEAYFDDEFPLNEPRSSGAP